MEVVKKIDRDEFIKNVEHWIALIGQQYGDEEDEELVFEVIEECVKFLNEQGFKTVVTSSGSYNLLSINESCEEGL